MSIRIPALASAALLALAAVAPARAATIFTIGDGGSSLIRFDSANPGTVTRVGFFGGDGLFLDAIDFRPGRGRLFGYSAFDNTYYTVNLNTAQLTTASVMNPGPQVNSTLLGLDFNPTIDKARVVADTDQNIVFDPNTGMSSGFTPLFFVAGDVNAGADPNVIENAYTNSFGGSTSTQQFVLDFELNVLAKLANNTGELRTVAQVTRPDTTVIDFDEFVGFDILTSDPNTNTAFAILSVGGTPGLFTIDLGTGVATALGDIGTDFGQPFSLAAQPAFVPEPSTFALTGLAASGLGFVLLRRRRAARSS